MSIAVLMSIRPEWCELIANGKKTIEVRKTKPNCILPLKVYIYCTENGAGSNPKRYVWKKRDDGFAYYWNGGVIGEFTCHNITPLFEGSDLRWWRDIEKGEYGEKIERETCLTTEQMIEYAGGENKDLWMWHISNPKIYDKPKELSAFKGLCKTNADCFECPYYDYRISECVGRTVKRPPQSWMYVEE